MTAKHFALVSTTSILVAFALVGLFSAADLIGRPFPGFLMLGNGVVASVGLPHWSATRDGEIFQQTVVAVGGVPVDRAEDVLGRVGIIEPGTSLDYRLRSPTSETERTVSVRRLSLNDGLLLFGTYLLNGLLLGGVGLLLLARSRRHPDVAAAVPFLLVGGLWGLSAMDLYGAHVLFRAHALCEALLFATLIHMALAFPGRLVSGPVTTTIVSTGYLSAVTLAAVYQAVLFDPQAYVVAHLFATALAGCALLLVVIVFAYRFLRCRSECVRPTMGLLAAGAGLALLPPVVFTLPEVMTAGSTPQNYVGWTVFIFPLVLCYVVSRGWMFAVPASRAGAIS